jgi:hypothetical protein
VSVNVNRSIQAKEYQIETMSDADKGTETAAKKAAYHYFLDIRNDGQGVGPHTPTRINWWLEHRMISPDMLARRIDQTDWIKLSEIKRFSNFLAKIANTPPPMYEKAPWEDEPATEKQLTKLAYFALPFPRTKLTKGEASRLIDFFVGVDPERERQYQNQPVEEEHRNILLGLIKRLPSSEREDYHLPADLTKGNAAALIDEIDSRLMEIQGEQDDEQIELDFLDVHFNDEDLREVLGYKKLTRKQLKELGQYLNSHNPGWESKSKYDTAEVVLKLFPVQKIAEKRKGGGGCKSAARTQSSKGCLLVIIPLVGILVHVLIRTIVSI